MFFIQMLQYLLVPQRGRPYQVPVTGSSVRSRAGSLNLRWAMLGIYYFTPDLSILTLCPCFVNVLHNKPLPSQAHLQNQELSSLGSSRAARSSPRCAVCREI